MKRILIGAAMLLGAVFSLTTGTAMASDGAALYKSKCMACHGMQGKGSAMAPAITGNEYIRSSSNEDITAVIVKGRNGAAKLYKKFVLGMPAQKLPAADVAALVEHLKALAK